MVRDAAEFSKFDNAEMNADHGPRKRTHDLKGYHKAPLENHFNLC